MRNILVVSASRADYGYYQPILKRIKDDPDLKLSLVVSGAHLAQEFGMTVNAIEEDGFEIAESVPTLAPSSKPGAISRSIGVGVIGLSRAYEQLKPDVVLLLGDRFEMLAAAVGLLPFAIPLAHIAGGESTEGAIDESARHALTKMSHLHFVSHPRFKRRIVQMGEDPWRVTVAGAPTLDNLRAIKMPARQAIEQIIDLPLEPAPLLVTFHPLTLAYQQTGGDIAELLAALHAVNLPVVFTAPGADTHHHVISQALTAYVREHENARLVTNLGTAVYFGLMTHARAMVGNSSSGIIEAASFGLPVVNVGDRQRGRLHGRNVIDVPCEQKSIVRGIRRAIAPAFRRSVAKMKNPYGDGQSAGRIVDVLSRIPLDQRLLFKRFRDLPASRS